MKIKHIGRKILALFLSAALAIPLSLPALAATDITGGDGQTGVDGSWAANYYPGEDGVRVTLVDSSGTAVSGSIDYTLNKNNCASKVAFHFGKHCKSYYRNQGYPAITEQSDDYSWLYPPTTNSSDKFPEPVISDNGSTTYLATKAYFRGKSVQKQVLGDINNAYKKSFSWENDLKSGKYQLMLEPILYFDYNGVYYAGTATELALFHKSNPAGFSDLGPAYRYNAPNAMYLESGRGGFEAATYSDRQANITISPSGFKYYDVDYIAKYMGVGFVYYEAAPVETATAYTYKYISTRYVPQGYTVDQMEANLSVKAADNY